MKSKKASLATSTAFTNGAPATISASSSTSSSTRLKRPTRASSAACSAPSTSTRKPISGQTKDRNRRLKMLLEDFAKPGLDLGDASEDILGDAYIFLIERFASDAGKKAGEFFTPRKVSEVVAKLAHPKPGRSHLRSGVRFGLTAVAGRRRSRRQQFPAVRSGIERPDALAGAPQHAAAQAGRRPDRLVRHAEFADPD